MDILGLVQYNWCTITTMSSLCGWQCCEDRCLMSFVDWECIVEVVHEYIYKC